MVLFVADNGRARAYNQTGDSDRVVEEAIDTCPVNCIYYTTFEDLVILERERESQQIKYVMCLQSLGLSGQFFA